LQQGLGGDYFRGVKSLLTLHNIHNQNRATKDLLTEANINPVRFNKLAMETIWGKTEYNMLGQSIVCSDGVNTVSPRYAKEIYQRFFSEGLERILKKRKDKVAGILNGIDTVYFDPATDAYIPQKYYAKTLNLKIKNKLALQKSLGLKRGNHALLSGVVTRLVPQKGIELVIDAIKKLAGDKHQFVILGDGDDVYEKQLTQLQKKYESSIAFVGRYDSHLAREIYAGADTFLMPSRYEPCGLTQMIAMRYGTVPIVHDTGGLHDSVIPHPKSGATGFVFNDFSPGKFRKSTKTFYE